MKESFLDTLLIYSFHLSSHSKSPKMFSRFQHLFKMLGQIEPQEHTATDTVWRCPWVYSKGRRRNWHESTWHLYDGKVYINFDCRNDFYVDLEKKEFIGVEFSSPDGEEDFGYLFLDWYLTALENELEKMMADPKGYRRWTEEKLPLGRRYGKIQRKDLWGAIRKKHLVRDELNSREVEEFKRAIRECDRHPAVQDMTQQFFLRACAVSYDAVFPREKDLPLREKYRRHADGRDNGLLKLPPEDAGAFSKWISASCAAGGHPWEIIRGGNSTHISLGPLREKDGWKLILDGYSNVRAAQTIKTAIALNRAKIKFDLLEKEYLAQMAEGVDWIGIVPENRASVYCRDEFEAYGDRILHFMRLGDFENEPAILRKIHWYPLKPLSSLIHDSMPGGTGHREDSTLTYLP